MQVELFGEHISTWGEGALWIADALHYVDIEGKKIVSASENGHEVVLLHLNFQPTTIVPCRSGKYLIAGEGGIYSWTKSQGVQFLVNPEVKQPLQRMNDGKCSPDGSFFVGSIHPKREPYAGLFRYDPDGSLTRILSGVSNSNGLVWTPDGGEMFYIDTVTKQVDRFSYKSGDVFNRKKAFSTEAIPGSPDGMCISSDGTLWIAMCHGGCVMGFSPDGKVREKIELPCREVTSCAFGGAHRDILYITTGVPKENVEPKAGRTFAVEGLGVQGLPTYSFAD